MKGGHGPIKIISCTTLIGMCTNVSRATIMYVYILLYMVHIIHTCILLKLYIHVH